MADLPREIRKLQKFQNEEIEVIYRKLRPAEDSGGRYPELKPGVEVTDGIRYERDVALKLRDGATIYTDIYRPESNTKVPAIIAWSPYGKRARFFSPEAANILGVPPNAVSPMAKTEGPDPAYWCHYGYAVINPDARGAGYSEGDIAYFGTQEGKDCHDLIEWVANLDWCNGKVGMAGNSWLAIAQWFTAAEQPPHLTAIAPWEGFTDFYRDMTCRGGVPEIGFGRPPAASRESPASSGTTAPRRAAAGGMGRYGPGYTEDTASMLRTFPFMNAYWEDKIARLDRITVPAYITAGWSHFHLRGSIEGFRVIKSRDKWLRVHRDFEWPDQYAPQNLDDLRRFFDRYLRGIRNGWEYTPRVRLDVMDARDVDHQVNRPEKEFPLGRTKHEKLFLNADTGQLSTVLSAKETSVRYDAATGRTAFSLNFDEDTELTGYMKLRLWVEAEGSDDMDLFIAVQKADKKGNFLPTHVLGQPYPGASGILRVSHRELDEARSTLLEPVLAHRREQRLQPKQIVPVEIAIWPSSRFWHAGEQLKVVVSGHYIREPGWFENFAWDLRNKGEHIIHTGGKFDSHLIVPKIPL